MDGDSEDAIDSDGDMDDEEEEEDVYSESDDGIDCFKTEIGWDVCSSFNSLLRIRFYILFVLALENSQTKQAHAFVL